MTACPRSLRLRLGLPLLLASSIAFGCSSSTSSNSPPVIDSMTAPATATIGPTGRYELPIVVSCHDDDGTIASGSIEIVGFASNPLKTPAQASFKDVTIVLQLDARAPKGPLAYKLVIVDNEGGRAEKAGTVTLQ